MRHASTRLGAHGAPKLLVKSGDGIGKLAFVHRGRNVFGELGECLVCLECDGGFFNVVLLLYSLVAHDVLKYRRGQVKI